MGGSRFTSVDQGLLKGRLLGQNEKNNVNLKDKVSRLSLNQREISRLQEENQTFRLEIGRLERENSEVTRLRVEVLELNRRLQEIRPLQNKKAAALGQSVSSTGLSGQKAVLVPGSQARDQSSFSRTK